MSFVRMEEDLTCPVCLELYADPLMMPCSHSICKACLLDIMKSRIKTDKPDMECPTCRMHHVLQTDQVEKLPKNLALENIVFRFQEIQSLNLSRGSTSLSPGVSISEEVMGSDGDTSSDMFEQQANADDCGMCESSPKSLADWWCQQCQVAYCNPCLERFHPRRGTLREHKVCRSSLKQKCWRLPQCPDHPNETVHIFCDTCQTVVCHLCVCQGQGSHCGHLILDINTARSQLQDVLKTAKDQLDGLMLVLQEKIKNISSQKRNLKTIQEMSKSCITSQHSTMVADLMSVLETVKLQALRKVDNAVQKQFDSLETESQAFGTTLTQCRGLISACESLQISHIEKSPNQVVISRALEESGKIDGSVPFGKDLSADCFENEVTFSSSFDPCEIAGLTSSPVFPHLQNSRDKDYDIRKLKSDENDSLSLKAPIQETEGSMSNNSTNGFKSSSGMLNKDKIFNLSKKQKKSQLRGKSLPLVQPSDVGYREQKKRLSNPECASTFSFPLENSELNKNKNANEENKDLKSKLIPSSKLISGSHVNENRSKSDNRKTQLKSRSSLTDQCDNLSVKSLDGTSSSDNLLLNASHLPPILDQVAELCKEASVDSQHDKNLEPTQKIVTTALSGFYTQVLSVMSDLTGLPQSRPVVITPAVRSSMSAVSSSSGAGRRTQSRTLFTWGFTSTTFVADPVTVGQWQVKVHRNVSQIGDIYSGYLFGVGVSTSCLGSKEHVGMNANSYGIICTKGHLAWSHNGKHSPIIQLTELPLSITLTLLQGHHGSFILYKILQSGSMTDICGRRLIEHGKGGDEKGHDGKKSVSKADQEVGIVFPVFTVSQRVKMELPIVTDKSNSGLS